MCGPPPAKGVMLPKKYPMLENSRHFPYPAFCRILPSMMRIISAPRATKTTTQSTAPSSHLPSASATVRIRSLKLSPLNTPARVRRKTTARNIRLNILFFLSLKIVPSFVQGHGPFFVHSLYYHKRQGG